MLAASPATVSKVATVTRPDLNVVNRERAHFRSSGESPTGPSGRLLGWDGQAGLAKIGEGCADATTWGINSAGRGPVSRTWPTGNSIVEHVAGVDDFEVAEATYRAAIARWPRARITLRQGIRVVHDTG